MPEKLAYSEGKTIQLDPRTYELDGIQQIPSGTKLIGVPGKTLLRVPIDSQGRSFNFIGDGLTLDGIAFESGNLWIDRGGRQGLGRNRDVRINNCEWKLAGKCAIQWHSGLANSSITNNLFAGRGRSWGAYGVGGYSGLTLANNELIDLDGGFHIDGSAEASGSGDLLVEQNYGQGIVGAFMEFQSGGTNLIFQDNDYQVPDETIFSGSKYAYSLILDKSRQIRIRRNRAIMKLKSQVPKNYTRIVFEVGGDDCLVEKNYSLGGNHVLAVNDGVGSCSVTVRNNRFADFAEGISNSFPAANRTLVQSNNGPDVNLGLGDEQSPGWIISRTRPRRNQRYGQPTPVPQEPAPVDPCAGVKAELKAVLNMLQAERAESAYQKTRAEQASAKLVTAKAGLVEVISRL